MEKFVKLMLVLVGSILVHSLLLEPAMEILSPADQDDEAKKAAFWDSWMPR